MNQKNKWQEEYNNSKGVPTTTRTSPSSSVTEGLKFIKKRNLLNGNKVIDLGCGIGRNALYLAKKGFQVTAVDFVESVLEKLSQEVKRQGLDRKSVTTVCASIGSKLPFPSDYFDLALDTTSTMSLNRKGITIFEKELRRVLKPGGVFISYILSNDDEYMLEYGNQKLGYYEAPQTNIHEHCRNQKDLKKIYKHWDFLKFEKVEKRDDYYGKVYTRRLWWLILKTK